jgi:hypothetical protein
MIHDEQTWFLSTINSDSKKRVWHYIYFYVFLRSSRGDLFMHCNMYGLLAVDQR